jgi:Zn-dependent protease
MSSVASPDPSEACPRCKTALNPGTLACSHCHALIHAAELERLAAAARSHEERGELVPAREAWTAALRLLPPESTQAQWIRSNTQRLDAATATKASTTAPPSWIGKTGPLAPLLILLAKGKSLLVLLKLKFLLTLGTFVAFYWALYGAKFGIGFAVLILVHEMGHFIDIRRRGLPAQMPVFVPGLGAYVRWSSLGVTARTRAFVSLAGPLAGCLGSVACLLLWLETGNTLWMALASASALLNVLNLIPIWILDGGQAVVALSSAERVFLACVALLLAIGFGQPVFLLVAAGAVYRLFTKDAPAEASRAVMAYYVLVLAALGYVLAVAPLATVRS